MFDRENVPVRISNLSHQNVEADEAEHRLVVMTCELNPLTPDLAGELHDFIKRTLYTRTGAEVNGLLKTAAFELDLLPQAVAFRMAADQVKSSFTLTHAKVGGIRAKRSKKSSAWTLEFTLTCEPASKDQLAQIVNSYLTMRCLTFANADPGLFDDEEKLSRRSRRHSPAEEDAEEPDGDEGDDTETSDARPH